MGQLIGRASRSHLCWDQKLFSAEHCQAWLSVQLTRGVGSQADKADYGACSYGLWAEGHEFLAPVQGAPRGMLAWDSQRSHPNSQMVTRPTTCPGRETSLSKRKGRTHRQTEGPTCPSLPQTKVLTVLPVMPSPPPPPAHRVLRSPVWYSCVCLCTERVPAQASKLLRPSSSFLRP